MTAVAADTDMHGLVEILLGPLADAGIAIRRDIDGIDQAERGRDRAAPGKRLTIGLGVAVLAIADANQILTSRSLVGRDTLLGTLRRNRAAGEQCQRDGWG